MPLSRAGRIGGMEPKPDDSIKPKRSLVERLAYVPSLASIALVILAVALVSVIFFTWLSHAMTGTGLRPN